jgi:hypothetical protein
MPDNVYLVFSRPPEDLPPDEYDRWYDLHIRENIVSPGFVSAQRFAVRPVRETPVAYSHLALYSYRGEMGSWRTDLDARLDRGEIVLPDWFDGIRFSTWDGVPLTDRIQPER